MRVPYLYLYNKKILKFEGKRSKEVQKGFDMQYINPYHAEFLKWNNSSYILALSIIIFRDIKMKTWRWSANSIEPGQTAQMCGLAWLYTGGKG